MALSDCNPDRQVYFINCQSILVTADDDGF